MIRIFLLYLHMEYELDLETLVTKNEYANTLRAYHQRHDEMKSNDRDIAESILQARGER